MNGLLRRRPLRIKLTVLIVVLLSAGLVVSSVIATTALSGYLLDQVDEQLVSASHPFSSFDSRALPPAQPQDQNGPRPPSAFSIIAIHADGQAPTIIGTAANASGSSPALPSDAAAASGTPFTVGAGDGSGDWRLLVTPLSNGSGWVVIGFPLTSMEGTVGRLVLLQVVVGAAVVLIAAVSGYFMVRRSLRPLDRMGATAHQIADGDLSQRVPVSGSSSEVDLLADSFNTMVSRIEVSFEAQQASETEARASEARMRRFVGDASHELRTPLTTIRGYAELVQQGAADDPSAAVARIEEEAIRMGSLVDDLLLLARMDQQRPLALQPVNVVETVEAAVSAARVAQPDRPVDLVTETSGAVLVSGEQRWLRHAVDNLMSNALRYTPVGSPITVTLAYASEDRRWVDIVVADRGPGIDAADAERIFERMYRTDEARSRVHGGSGLGLAIVKSIAESHGGTVSVSSTRGEGSAFVIRLPLAAAQPA